MGAASCIRFVVTIALAAAAAGSPAQQQDRFPSHMSLAGRWRFQLDPDDRGVKDKWYKTRLDDQLTLPGTTDENGKGTRNQERETRRLTRVFYYVGPAWYQRDVVVPDNWQGKRLTLFLERSKETSVWVDGKPFGTRNSLSVPHIYDVTSAMTPGKHVLAIQVDNRRKIPIGDPHAISDETQTNWNGIIGRIELRATDPVWIEKPQVYPDVAANKARVRITIGNATGRPVRGTLSILAEASADGRPRAAPSKSVEFTCPGTAASVEVDYAMEQDPLLWDEFNPAVYHLTISLAAADGPNRYSDRKEVTFGMREFRTKATHFAINGRTTFLRGKMDACVFPLTGHPPMDVDGWLRVLKIAQSYGINHYRFHTWCPPEAAFDAADRLGIYLQPELPNWTAHGFGDPAHDKYMWEEADRILDAYGNHPCFVMFALGNELPRGREIMARLVRHCREKDPRHLYAEGSNNFWETPSLAPGDDYWTTMMTEKWTKMVRGSCHLHSVGHVNNSPPSTMVDYSRSIAGIPVPVISHEIGQYSIYPDFKQIARYTGVLRAWDLQAVQDNLRTRNMLDQADDFAKASGALAVICYKEEIEAALRTPGFGGFHLMDIQDFPGQGAALVGILDALMDSKDLVEPATFREFCSPTVPLVRMSKYAWTTDETFVADVQVAHFGPADMTRAAAAWSIQDATNRAVASGTLDPRNIPQGCLSDLGRITASLAQVAAPARLTLVVQLTGTPFVNRYPLWVYPTTVDATPPPDVSVNRHWDRQVKTALAEGHKVLLLPPPASLPNSVAGAFQPDFCTYALFGKKYDPPGTLGILCDPRHPALAAFPTEFHSNWQWWDLVKKSRPIILDDTPPSFRPLVQVIDNLERNHKLGLVFEAKVGHGRLLVCSIDLEADLPQRPAARQLLHSLLRYMGSNQVQPSQSLDEPLLDQLLTPAPRHQPTDRTKLTPSQEIDTVSLDSPEYRGCRWQRAASTMR